MRKRNGWCIWSQWSGYLSSTFARTRTECIKLFERDTDTPWRRYREQGFECRPVLFVDARNERGGGRYVPRRSQRADAEGGMSSEVEYGLPEQPGDTCPMIDDVISMLRNAESHLKGYDRLEDPDELKEVISNIEAELFWGWKSNAEGKLEEIRAHVTAIRKWGQAWKDLAKDLMAEKEANSEEAA